MKTIQMMVAASAVALTIGLSALQNEPVAVLEGVCEKLGEVNAGNKFNTLSKSTALSVVREEAAKLGADKVSLQLVSHKHPKLGEKYTAKAIAWKCN